MKVEEFVYPDLQTEKDNRDKARQLMTELEECVAELSGRLIESSFDLLKAKQVLNHVLAMADDAYFVGHPEWHEIVKEARNALAE